MPGAASGVCASGAAGATVPSQVQPQVRARRRSRDLQLFRSWVCRLNRLLSGVGLRTACERGHDGVQRAHGCSRSPAAPWPPSAHTGGIGRARGSGRPRFPAGDAPRPSVAHWRYRKPANIVSGCGLRLLPRSCPTPLHDGSHADHLPRAGRPCATDVLCCDATLVSPLKRTGLL